MKKILVSAAVAAMALSTTASALEDIKVNGQAKLWYETDNQGKKPVKDRSLFDKDSASGEVVFKLGMTGKHGDVGFGATLYQGTDMGLANDVVGGLRTEAGVDTPFFGELYFTAPVAPDTVLKFGKQELDTPLAFTERWNAMPNTFDAAVAINSSVENLTLIGAYIGKDNASGNFKASDDYEPFHGTAFALAGLYKQDDFNANLWLYQINNVEGTGGLRAHKGVTVNAAWFDAGMKAGDVNVKGYLAYAMHDDEQKWGANRQLGLKDKDTFGAALAADMTVEGIKIFGAASYVSEGDLPLANTATGFKKTMLPTQGIYTDGQYVAQPGSMAFKLSASTKIADTGLSLNVVNNTNSNDKNRLMAFSTANTAKALETTEVYATVTQKAGAFDLMGIVMHRSMNDSATDKSVGGQYVRIVASVNF